MRRLFLTPFLFAALAHGQIAQQIVAIQNSASGSPALYDTVSTANIGSNASGSIATTVGSALTNQALFLLIGEDDTGPYVVRPGSVLSTNSSGLVTLNWQKLGATKTGNGNYHGECFEATGGGIYTGATTTFFQLTGTTGNASQVLQYSFSGVNQGSISSAGSATCVSATSGAQSVTISANDLAMFGSFDTNNNRTVSGCTSSTDYSAYAETGTTGAHCSSSPTSSLTFSGYGSTSVAVATDIPHNNGSSAPPCAFEGYQPFTGGTGGTNIVSNLSTLQSSTHGNDPGIWSGAGTVAWNTIDTGLLNNTSTLCGDLTSYNSGTTAFGAVITTTGSSVSNNIQFGPPASLSLPQVSETVKFCTDIPSSATFNQDLFKAQIGSDQMNIGFQCNGSSCFFNGESANTVNTPFATYTTGGSCSAGGSGWVTLALQNNETGTACSGKPCAYAEAYTNTGGALGSLFSGQQNGTWSGQQIVFNIGNIGAQSNTTGYHLYFAKWIINYQGTFPGDY